MFDGQRFRSDRPNPAGTGEPRESDQQVRDQNKQQPHREPSFSPLRPFRKSAQQLGLPSDYQFATHMLNYTAFSVVFMVVSIAVPHMAAGIAGGTIGLALSHAFEAAYVAQTIIRPITSALQTEFNKVAQIGNGSGDTNGEATGWVKAMDFGRQTQQLGNLGSDGGQRVQAPKDVRGTSIMTSRAPNTTPMNPDTARYGNGNGRTTIRKATTKM